MKRRELLSRLPALLPALLPARQDFSLTCLPPPKFSSGQSVFCDFFDDDSLSPSYGQTFRNFGTVCGYFWENEPPYWTGWTYQVKWTDHTLEPHLTGCLEGGLREDDLQPLPMGGV